MTVAGEPRLSPGLVPYPCFQFINPKGAVLDRILLPLSDDFLSLLICGEIE